MMLILEIILDGAAANMWWKSYKDYPNTASMKSEKVETGKGIIGCEMHDLNGWGEEYHHKKNHTSNSFLTLCSLVFGTKVTPEEE